MSDTDRTPIPPVYRIGLITWTLLLLLQLLWHGWLFPPQQLSRWLVLAFTGVPLLLPLFAIHDIRRALLWVGILSLFYFCHGVAEAWSSSGERALALTEIVLTVGLIAMLGAGVKRKPATPR